MKLYIIIFFLKPYNRLSRYCIKSERASRNKIGYSLVVYKSLSFIFNPVFYISGDISADYSVSGKKACKFFIHGFHLLYDIVSYIG